MGWSTNRPTDYFAVGVQPGVGEEATTFFFPKHLTGTGFDSAPDVGEEREGGGGQEVALAYKKLIKADGNAIFNLRGVGAVYALIDGALGNTATTAKTIPTVAAGEFTSAFPTGTQRVRIVPAPTLPNLTLEQRYSDEIERVTNAKINQLTVEGAAGVPIKITGAFNGGGTVFQRDTASGLTTTYETGDPIFYPRGSYVITGPGGGTVTASGAKMTKFKLTVMRHLDTAIQTTDLWRDELIELTSDYTFDCTLKYEDRKLFQAIQYGGGSVVPILIPTAAVMLHSNNGAASGATAYRSITIGMSNLLGKTAKVNKLEPDGKTVYIDAAFTSIKPAGATDSLVVDLVVASNAWVNFP